MSVIFTVSPSPSAIRSVRRAAWHRATALVAALAAALLLLAGVSLALGPRGAVDARDLALLPGSAAGAAPRGAAAPLGPSLVLTVPATVTTGMIPVSWTVNIGAASLATLTLQVSGTHAVAWQPWLALTFTGGITQGADLFPAPVLSSTYILSGVVSDAGGTIVSSTVSAYVEPARVFVPLTLRSWPAWHERDIYEPNDHPSQAWGPLESDGVYKAYIWCVVDPEDYYAFTPGQSGSAAVNLTGMMAAVSDYDLYLYTYDGSGYQLVASSRLDNTAAEQITFNALAGETYYVRVYPYRGCDTENPYTLIATYPGP